MRILIIGCGGREHAIAKKLSESYLNPEIYYIGADSNPGMDAVCVQHYSTDVLDNYTKEFIQHKNIDFAIIGPEKFLLDGWSDYFWETGIPVLGPKSNHAQIETSKMFARNLLHKASPGLSPVFHEIVWCENEQETLDQLHTTFDSLGNNFVVKADGLMGGKGVKVSGDHLANVDEGIGYALSLLKKEGDKVLIEEKLEGQEFSLMSLTDGSSFVHFPVVQDNKRAYDGDKGPNTGGMGSVSYPNHRLPFLTRDNVKKARGINEMVVNILNDQYRGENRLDCYRGVIYGSFMKTNDGKIKVIEFNARFGDPECINALRLLKNDFASLCYHAANGTLETQLPVHFKHAATVCKYVVPDDYPNVKDIGSPIEIPSDTKHVYGIYSSVSQESDSGTFRTRGSRAVAFIAASGKMAQAERAVEHQCKKVQGNVRWRSDIGKSRNGEKIASPTVDVTENMQTPVAEVVGEPKKETSAYAASGVNIDEGNLAIQKIQKYVKETYTNDVTSEFGDFAGIMRVASGCDLVFSTDGVGTKSEVVLGYYGNRGYQYLGMDIVNHCINDTLVKGACPFAFLDYYGTSKLNSDSLKYLVKGASQACRSAGCVLIGGETAEMPGTYKKGKCDVVGTMIGRVLPEEVIDGKRDIKAGNVVMAFASSSPHTNGYSLIRKVLRESKELRDDQQFMEEICQPHRSYWREIHRLRTQHGDIKINGLCHITGGGLKENPRRVLPKNLDINWQDWHWPRIYKRIQEVGGISREEMLRVFNCGVGMLLIVPEESAPALEVLFFDCFRVGTVVETAVEPKEESLNELLEELIEDANDGERIERIERIE